SPDNSGALCKAWRKATSSLISAFVSMTHPQHETSILSPGTLAEHLAKQKTILKSVWLFLLAVALVIVALVLVLLSYAPTLSTMLL
ncbi:MAG: hypothetical protein ACON4F_02165, partial [Candidatus Puniceispirillaceae bacterium]